MPVLAGGHHVVRQLQLQLGLPLLHVQRKRELQHKLGCVSAEHELSTTLAAAVPSAALATTANYFTAAVSTALTTATFSSAAFTTALAATALAAAKGLLCHC